MTENAKTPQSQIASENQRIYQGAIVRNIKTFYKLWHDEKNIYDDKHNSIGIWNLGHSGSALAQKSMILTREWLYYLLPILANQNNHYYLDQHFPKNNAALLNILYMFIKKRSSKVRSFFPTKGLSTSQLRILKQSSSIVSPNLCSPDCCLNLSANFLVSIKNHCMCLIE